MVVSPTKTNPQPRSARQQLTVGVADMIVSKDHTAMVVTYALGSCIGVTAYDPETRIGGMLHFMLPKPPKDGQVDESRPYMYATRGIPALIKQLEDLGADARRMVFCAAGAAEVMEDGGFFAIGQRNRTIMRKIFWKKNLVLAAEDTGGSMARTMSLNLGTGEVRVKAIAEENTLWQV